MFNNHSFTQSLHNLNQKIFPIYKVCSDHACMAGCEKKTETYSTMTASISFTWRGCYFGKASSSVQVSQRFHNLLILDRTWERLTCWKLFKCTFTSTQTWNRCLSIIIFDGSFNEYFKFLAKINGKVRWN